jgi:hypothetical protein
MPIDTRKLVDISNSPTWILSMYFSIHTLYLILIFILISWNVYNTHQYQILAERQSKFENILKELVPSTPSFQHESTTIDQWFNQISHFIQRLTSKDPIQSYTVRIILLRIKDTRELHAECHLLFFYLNLFI